jgi:flotillin
MTLEIGSSKPFMTRNAVPVFVEGVAQVKVDGDDDSIKTAAELFLSKDPQEIMSIAHDTLNGHLLSIVGTMEIEELIKSVDSWCKRLAEATLPDYHKMGLTIVSISIKEIRDSVGYLEQLGRKEVARAKQQADIAIAEFTK